MSFRALIKLFNNYGAFKVSHSAPVLFNRNVHCYIHSDSSVPVEKIESKNKTNTQKITLILPGDSISVTTIEEAQKLSRRRDLKLVKILDFDTKTQRPIFKLMTGAEYRAEDLKSRTEKKASKNDVGFKGEKLLTLSMRISDHDIESKVKNINRWISKNYEVRIIINGDASNMDPAEKIYSKLETALKNNARFLQKRYRGSDLRFQIVPPKKDSSTKNA